jgi:hypothetical protein
MNRTRNAVICFVQHKLLSVKDLAPERLEDFSGMGECKRSPFSARKTFSGKGQCKSSRSRGRKTFSAWGIVKDFALGIGRLFWHGGMYIKGLAPGIGRLFRQGGM